MKKKIRVSAIYWKVILVNRITPLFLHLPQYFQWRSKLKNVYSGGFLLTHFFLRHAVSKSTIRLPPSGKTMSNKIEWSHYVPATWFWGLSSFAAMFPLLRMYFATSFNRVGFCPSEDLLHQQANNETWCLLAYWDTPPLSHCHSSTWWCSIRHS